MNAPTRWHIRLFGTLRIEADDGRTDANESPDAHTRRELRHPAGKARSLFAYLLLSPGVRLTREQIMDALWPELPLDRARRALSDSLYRLRETSVGTLIDSEGDEIALVSGAHVRVDVWEFMRSAHVNDTAAIDRALALAVAPLLPEIYDDWIIARRTALQEERIALLRKRIARAEEENDLARANALYQEVIEADNLDEAAWRGRIRTLARMGHLRDALDTFHRLEELLDDELGVPPELESSRLAAQIEREYAAQRQQTPTGQPGVLPVFVGRLRERAHLIAALDNAIAGQGGMCIVLAEAGMGRSALLQELEHSARWRGAQIVWGRGDGDRLPQPFAPLREALRAALPEARMQQLEEFVRAPWRAAVRQLLADAEVNSEPPSPARNPEELALAVGSTLTALGRIVPYLILLDDMQWADRSLWQLLDALRQPLAQSRVLLVLSCRLEEAQNDAAVRDRLTAWEQAGDSTVQQLAGLSESELGDMLAHHRLLPAHPETLAKLHRDSGGNPLLAFLLASAAQPGAGESLPIHGDALARTFLLRRVHALPIDLRAALEVASVLGTHFSWQNWASVWQALDRPSALLPLFAGQLEQQEFLLLEGAIYRFANTLLQAAILAELNPSEKRRLHERIFAVLEAFGHAPLNERLHHAQHAGMRAETFRLAQAAGKSAAATWSMHSARTYFTLALAHVDDNDLNARYELHVGRAQAEALLAMRTEQADDLAAARELGERLQNPLQRVEAAELTADYLLTTGDPEEAHTVAARALETLEASVAAIADPAQVAMRQARLHELLARIQRERKQTSEALTHIALAGARYEAVADAWGVAHTTDVRGGLAWDVGDYQRAAQDHLEAANRFAAIGDVLQEAKALNNLGSTYWELGDYAGARTTHERAMVVCHDAGDLLGEGDNIDNLGGVFWSLGDYDTAIEHYSTALKMRRAIRDEWGVSISLGNLGSALLRQGNPQAALAYYEEAWPRYRKIGRLRSEGYVLHHIGWARLELGDVEAAFDALRAALEIRLEIGDQSKVIETHVALAHAWLVVGDAAQASEHLDAALGLLAETAYPPVLQQEVHFAAYAVRRREAELHSNTPGNTPGNTAGDNASSVALEHLGKAELATTAICATLPPETVTQFMTNVPLNRQIGEAITEHATVLMTQLAAIDAPRGRTLRPEEEVTVRWTIATPGDALIPDAAERRRRALRRLLDEAAQQGAAPTDDALAAALGVSRRTILRDIEALAASGLSVSTRFRA